jgi:uncharacterized membrane-anchored protein YitT (DUF2179 family)
MTPAAAAPAHPHTVADDVQAVGTAVILVSLGLSLLNSAGLTTGGTPGLAFVLSYATGLPLGVAWKGMGPRFTAKTLAAVSSLSVGVGLLGHVVTVRAEPLYAAIAGGVLIGTGLLVMFRHKASFGGINILALYLQRRKGWAPGKVQLVVDAAILAAALLLMDSTRVAWSLLGAVAVNAVLIWNHRPGRYLSTPEP